LHIELSGTLYDSNFRSNSQDGGRKQEMLTIFNCDQNINVPHVAKIIRWSIIVLENLGLIGEGLLIFPLARKTFAVL
jgi:hypothetical protein